MLNFNKIFFFFIIYSAGIYSEDYDTPYEINPGDINSSELINYQNQNIKDSLKTWGDDYLVGKWTCSGYGQGDWAEAIGNPVATTPNYTFKRNGAIRTVENTETSGLITDVGETNTVLWKLFGDTLFGGRMKGGLSHGGYELNVKSKTRFNVRVTILNSGNLESFVEICDKTHFSTNPNNTDSGTFLPLTVSNHPTNFTVTSSTAGGARTLSWTDNSSNETGFKIFRKESPSATFTLIANLAQNETSYIDGTSISGDKVLWYKVVPVSASGDGKPSKVVRIRYNDPNTP